MYKQKHAQPPYTDDKSLRSRETVLLKSVETRKSDSNSVCMKYNSLQWQAMITGFLISLNMKFKLVVRINWLPRLFPSLCVQKGLFTRNIF